MQRIRIMAALAATLALTACAPDDAEHVTGPGRPVHDQQPAVPTAATIGDSIVVRAAEGGNAFGSGT